MWNNINKLLAEPVPARRRMLLAILGSALAAPLAWAARLLAPRPSEAFQAENANQTLRALYGDANIQASDKIRITAANLAENGAVVPIKIEVGINAVRAVSIIAVENPIPLVGQFILGKTTTGFIATRIKLAQSGDVIAVVETADGLYQARKTIEVTIGGCGV